MIQQKHGQQMLADQATSATVAPAQLGLKWMRRKSGGRGGALWNEVWKKGKFKKKIKAGEGNGLFTNAV